MYRKHAYKWLLAATVLIAWILQGCNGCNGTNERREDNGAAIDTVIDFERDTLNTWTEQRLIKWKGWVDSSLARVFNSDSLQKTVTDTLSAEQSTVMDTTLFRDFSPYFVYSPDSSLALDMYSYGNFLHKTKSGKSVLENGEPDTEVAVVNVQTKKRERILFAGPGTVIKEAVWINKHTVLIAGGTYNEHDQLIPAIWKYDTNTRQLDNYE